MKLHLAVMPAPHINPTPPFIGLLHFEIRQSLGEGGFGQVFEAWDGKLQRPVAIKRLKDLHSSTHSASLVREAQMAASLRHAAFVRIFSLEDDGQHQTIVMELIRGLTLKQLLADTPPDAEKALDIVSQVAWAMREAHDSGLIHGDLKPSNLMLEPSGAVRILDFGLAAQCDTESTTSLLHADPQGTIAYMAPERLLGAPLRPQNDIYALGVVLYELLTGARPFPELNGLALAAALTQSSSDQWPYPAHMSAAHVQLVRAMTNKACSSRISDMAQVAQYLKAIDNSSGGIALRANVPVAKPQMRFKKPLQALLLAATAMLLGGGWYFTKHDAELPALWTPFSVAKEMRSGLAALRLSDRTGSLDRAISNFNGILEREPKNAAAAAGLSLAYLFRYANEDLDEIWLQKADASAQQAYQLNEQLAISHAARSMVLCAHGKWDIALAESTRALELDGSDTFAFMAKLKALIGLRRFAEARDVAESAIRNFPQDAWYRNYLGEILYQQGDYKGAEQAYRQSIALQPDAVQAYANLSAALYWQNRQDESMKVLQDGLQIRPSPVLYGNLGNALFVRGEYVKAASAFERAVSPDGGDPASYIGWANLADTLLWIPGRLDDARAAYQKARDMLAPRLAREPDNFLLVSRMSLYCARLGQIDDARKFMQHAVALAPKNANVHFRSGLASELLGDRQVALKEIDIAIGLGYPVKLVEAEPDLLRLRRDANYLKH